MFRNPEIVTTTVGRRTGRYVVAGILIPGALSLAGPAYGAPSGGDTVDRTVNRLQEQGYNVIVNRTGTAALSDCTVSAVRAGVTHEVTDVRGSDIEPLIISKTVFVDVAC
jgi:hypothetical protein